jgi:hypothetical protein
MTQAVIEHTPSAWHGLPAAVKGALGLKSMKWWVLGAALLGFALPALVALLMPLPANIDPHKQGLAEWTWLSMQVLNLISCSVAVGFAPLVVKKGFPFCAAALQLTLCIVAACVGFKLSPWGALQFSTALTLCALFIGQAWLWMGASALASWIFFFAPRVSRAVVALKLALLITALLWSRPYLLTLYKKSPAWAVPATQTLVEFSPVTAASSAWNLKESSIDLFKAPITYDLWIGSYQPVMYAKVWPGRADEPADAVVLLEQDAGLLERAGWSAFTLFRRAVTGLGLIPFCVLAGLAMLIGVDFMGQRKAAKPCAV